LGVLMGFFAGMLLCAMGRVAELTGEARHHAKWRPLTADEEPPR